MDVASLDVLSAAHGRAQIPVAPNLHRGAFSVGDAFAGWQAVVRRYPPVAMQSEIVSPCGGGLNVYFSLIRDTAETDPEQGLR